MVMKIEKRLIKYIERRDWDTVRTILLEVKPSSNRAEGDVVIPSANEKVHGSGRNSSSTGKNKPMSKIKNAFSSANREVTKTTTGTSRSIQIIKNQSLALHQACRFTAPADIVLSILSINPELAKSREPTKNEYPLHIAARKGLSIDAIEALADRYPPALTAQECDGRTPLHLSCLNGHIYPYLATVFCKRALSAVAMDDNGGSTPMELFMHSDISKNRHMQECMEVLDVLHKASSLYWENRRRNSSEMYRHTLRKKRSSMGTIDTEDSGKTFAEFKGH